MKTFDEVPNKFLVGSKVNGGVIIMNPPRGEMSKEDALILAAWLVAVSDESFGESFNDILKKVLSL